MRTKGNVDDDVHVAELARRAVVSEGEVRKGLALKQPVSEANRRKHNLSYPVLRSHDRVARAGPRRASAAGPEPHLDEGAGALHGVKSTAI